VFENIVAWLSNAVDANGSGVDLHARNYIYSSSYHCKADSPGGSIYQNMAAWLAPAVP